MTPATSGASRASLTVVVVLYQEQIVKSENLPAKSFQYGQFAKRCGWRIGKNVNEANGKISHAGQIAPILPSPERLV